MMLQIISIPADAFASGHLDLPAAGKLINLSPVKYPVVLRGIKPSPDNPMQFSFFMDVGDSNGIDDTSLKQEADRLIKYFLAALTIPEKDLWVNLSPYEKNRMIPPNLAQTAMGRDMLAQDYLLKQITASLIYPEGKYGKKFWDRVYEKARLSGYEQSLAAVSTFNKVWIVPQRAEVYVHQGIAYIHQAYLNVMLEKDYKALEKMGMSPIYYQMILLKK